MESLPNKSVKQNNASVREATLQRLKESGVLSQPHTSTIQSEHELIKYLKEVEIKLDKELSGYDLNLNLEENLEELHRYNIVKDATQSLLGSLSMQTGLSVTALHKQFGV